MDIKVTFRCQLENGRTIKLFGIENDADIDCRYEYLEEKIVDNSIIDKDFEKISLKNPTEFNFIEHIVAMNKALHENIYQTVKGKWYFTRLQLSQPIKMKYVNSLVLKLKSNFHRFF